MTQLIAQKTMLILMKTTMLNNLFFSKVTQPYVNVINLRRLTILKKQAFMDFHECLLLFCCLCRLEI
ncbi:hypothetical protein L1279_003564 [Planomicrobium sp. HSC-17F08]|nr:hypothetical protein [Planomicrobium sp. HSC-17F08]